MSAEQVDGQGDVGEQGQALITVCETCRWAGDLCQCPPAGPFTMPPLDGPADEPPVPDERPTRAVRLTRASSIKPRRVRWMWDGRVPLGEITLVAGREGAGKSTFLAWMASAITRGKLAGEFEGQPRAVLYAAAEDSWAYTVVPRLIAAGADMSMVYRVDVVDAEHGNTKMTLPVDTDAVLRAGAKVDSAVLMLDPGLSFLDDKIDTFRTPEVRPALEALRRAAERHGQSVIMLCHFNKGQGTDVLTKIAGSRAFAEVARAALAVAVNDPDEDDDDEAAPPTEDGPAVILSQAKNNLGRSNLPNLTYVIRDTVVETEDGDAHVGRLHWTGVTDRTAEQALNGVKRKKKPEGELAQRLVDYLERNGLTALKGLELAHADVKAVTVRSTLRRLVERGRLIQPYRGAYSVPSTTPKVAPSPVGCATTATSATTAGQSVCSSSGGSATSATSMDMKVAVVPLVAGVAGGEGATTCPRCSLPVGDLRHEVNCPEGLHHERSVDWIAEMYNFNIVDACALRASGIPEGIPTDAQLVVPDPDDDFWLTIPNEPPPEEP